MELNLCPIASIFTREDYVDGGVRGSNIITKKPNCCGCLISKTTKTNMRARDRFYCKYYSFRNYENQINLTLYYKLSADANGRPILME